MRFTSEDVDEMKARMEKRGLRPARCQVEALGSHPPAKGVLPKTGMNKTEARYELVLKARRQAGEVSWFRFEAVTLKLAHDCRYTPDFLVMLADGTLELHEVKGFMREDAAIKLKVAAEHFPFRVMIARPDKQGWIIEEMTA